MKKLFISMIAVALGAGAVQAQQETPQQTDGFSHRHFEGRREGHHREQMLAEKLHFSDQQKQQLKDINQQYHLQLADLRKNEDITVREYKSKLATLRKDHRQQVDGLLTPDQKTQLQKMREEHKELAKVNAKARAERMKIKLGLSDEQAKQLQDLRSSTAAKMKQIHNDQSLTPEQKHDQIKALVKEQREQMKSVLTPDQQKQLQEMRHAHQHEWSK